MKRNNIFMWAYITAICLSAVIRAFTDYPIWSSLILAITVSSAIFAIEDLISSLCRSLEISCNIEAGYISQIKPDAQKDKAYYERVGAKMQPYTDDFEDLIENNRELLTSVDAFLALVEQHEARIKKDRHRLEKYRNAADILVYVGFLCLFCIAFFSPQISISLVLFEIITVIAFAIILITQQLNQLFASRNKQKAERNQEMLLLNDERKKRRINLEEEIDNIVVLIEKMQKIDSEIKHKERDVNRLEQELEKMEVPSNAD